MSIVVRIEGIDELTTALRRGGRVGGELDKAVKKLSEKAAEQAKGRAPVRTGRLKRSINVRRVGEASYRISADTPYSGYVEHGTGRMKPQPYMRPAIEQVAKELRPEVERLLKRVVRGG